MNYLSTTLGVSLPLIRKRDLVMKEAIAPGQRETSSFFPDQDSFEFMDLSNLKGDDETASTVSSFDDSFTSTASVNFAEPLVTHVYERPLTTRQEKRVLFYSEREYRQFRYEYIYGVEPRDSVVRFSPEVVTQVHEYQGAVDKDTLYYSEKDLQR